MEIEIGKKLKICVNKDNKVIPSKVFNINFFPRTVNPKSKKTMLIKKKLNPGCIPKV